MSISETHELDAAGNPAGGTASGDGFTIDWSLAKPEDLLEAVAGRLRFYLDHPELGQCTTTVQMVRYIGLVKEQSQRRKLDRDARGVRGTFAK